MGEEKQVTGHSIMRAYICKYAVGKVAQSEGKVFGKKRWIETMNQIWISLMARRTNWA